MEEFKRINLFYCSVRGDPWIGLLDERGQGGGASCSVHIGTFCLDIRTINHGLSAYGYRNRRGGDVRVTSFSLRYDEGWLVVDGFVFDIR